YLIPHTSFNPPLMKKNLLLLSFQIIATLIYSQEVFPLYTGMIPNSKVVKDQEVTLIRDAQHINVSKVSTPTLTAYLPSSEKVNGTAIIICPGGGYTNLAIGHEGFEVAKALNEMGVTAFVLKYRIPNDTTMVNKEIGPLQDAQRAIQMVRQRSKEWHINPARVGIMGFSAGGHLASTAATHFSKAVIDNKENISVRPDFAILLYPVVSLSDSLAHMGSRNQLIGKNPSAEKIKEYSNELQVTPETPPAFIVHASNDNGVKVENSIYFYLALQKNKIAAEMHIYPEGGHGFGMDNTTTKDKWMERLKNWLDMNGWLKQHSQN
ncbi:MAG: alpha/beta hydrolase, partial [Chitinophagaceae bacterium]